MWQPCFWWHKVFHHVLLRNKSSATSIFVLKVSHIAILHFQSVSCHVPENSRSGKAGNIPESQNWKESVLRVPKSAQRSVVPRVPDCEMKADPGVHSEHWIVVTSIQGPAKTVGDLANIKGWKLLVVGDTKTPKDWRWVVIFVLTHYRWCRLTRTGHASLCYLPEELDKRCLETGPDFKWMLPLGTGCTGALRCALSPWGPYPPRWGSKKLL